MILKLEYFAISPTDLQVAHNTNYGHFRFTILKFSLSCNNVFAEKIYNHVN